MLEAFGISAAELRLAMHTWCAVCTDLLAEWLVSGPVSASQSHCRFTTSDWADRNLVFDFPPLDQVRLIFIGWGLSSGLTFWAAMIKAVSLIAPLSAQGRFFGWLEGGRGAADALASLAVGLFALLLSRSEMLVGSALQVVIWLYAGFSIAVAWPVLNWLNDDEAPSSQSAKEKVASRALMADLGLLPVTLVCGWPGDVVGLSTVLDDPGFRVHPNCARSIGAQRRRDHRGRLWMRPIGAILAGYLRLDEPPIGLGALSFGRDAAPFVWWVRHLLVFGRRSSG